MRGLRRYRRDRVVVNTKDDQSLRGVLVEVHKDCLVLADAEYLPTADGEPTPIDGRPLILTANVAWIQVLSG